VVEMSQSSWLVAAIVPGIERHPAKKLEPDKIVFFDWCDAGERRRRKAGRTNPKQPLIHADPQRLVKGEGML
jgi:transposase